MAVPAVARSLTIVGILGLLLLSDFLMHVHEARFQARETPRGRPLCR